MHTLRILLLALSLDYTAHRTFIVGPSTTSTHPTSRPATQALQPFQPTPYTQKPSNQAPASTTSTHRTYILAPHHQKPSKPDARRNTGIFAWIRFLAARIPWLHPAPSPQNTTTIVNDSTFTSLITSTTLTTLKTHAINLFYTTHIHAYFTRTTRYIAGVRAHEEQRQQSRLLASLDQIHIPLSTAVSLYPTRQEIIQEVTLQAGFKPGAEVPYPALWVEPWVRARVQARYERGPLHSVSVGWRRIEGWFRKLKIIVYSVLVLSGLDW